MRATTSRTRWAFGAPIASEEDRFLFQRRLSLTGLILFVLAFGFSIVQVVSLTVVSPGHLRELLVNPSTSVQFATTFSALALHLALRRGKRSVATLSLLDPVSFFTICCGWTWMIASNIRGAHPELIALLASSYTLVVRAAFIPSTPLRTALVSAASLAPLVPVTAMLPASQLSEELPLPAPMYVSIWIALGVGATTAISYVVHGLRAEVRKAMRLGQYVLEDKIGEGGMGVVYRASHALLRRPAAIKLLSGAAENALERFEREVQITARLTHPNTVSVFDYGRTPDGAFYYAMEYIDGVTLEDLVFEHGPQPARRIVHVLLQVCGALEEAHAAGLVHRDIKPQNIMLTERGLLPDVVKVLDFGLVKDTASSGDLVQSGVQVIMGTPHYMAPETISNPENIDGRADIYAVGATAYQLLTGSRVFEGESIVEICSKHLHEKPAAPSSKRADVPAALEKIILSCLAKKKEDRPKDAAELAAALREVQRDIGDWTRDEARSWWAERTRAASDPRLRAKSAQISDATVFGQTIEVALEGRDRGAA